jgi:hypothetical protein
MGKSLGRSWEFPGLTPMGKSLGRSWEFPGLTQWARVWVHPGNSQDSPPPKVEAKKGRAR